MPSDLSTGRSEALRPDRPRQQHPSRAAPHRRLLQTDASPDYLSDRSLAAHSQAYLRRNLKLANEQGKWIHCVTYGRHAEDVSLENFRRIIVYFCSARPASGHNAQAVWFIKEAFIVPLHRHMPSSLHKQVM